MLTVEDKERREFRSWQHRHDRLFCDLHGLEQQASERVALLLVGRAPRLRQVGQELGGTGHDLREVAVLLHAGQLGGQAVTLALVVSALLCEPGLMSQQTPHHEFSVSARRYAFDPPRLEVHSGDLVKITLHSEDIPHSFVVDAYRISKRVSAGGTVTFEFLADRAGTFPFYCSLTIEDGCRDMKGQLVVRPEEPAVSTDVSFVRWFSDVGMDDVSSVGGK